MEIKYFDNAATTKVKNEVLKEMFPYFSIQYGNPSSVYSIGRASKRAIEQARKKVAQLISADSNEIYFTGCGSESDNTALKGFCYANRAKGNHIITSKIEHHAILNTCKTLEKQGFKVTYLDVDECGFIDLQQLTNSITDETILISIMFANNEIGTIEPIEKISKIAKCNNIVLHTDAVQAVGNVPIDVKKMGIDMLSLSGHKLYGPKGVGALYVKKGIEFDRFLDGGHQEKGKRSGTENVAGIVGLGKACEIANFNMDKHQQYLSHLRDYFLNKMKDKFPDIKINGDIEKRLPGNANISFKNIDAVSLLLKLDQYGICASSGSACNSGSQEPSHVLVAIGLPSDMANGTLRVTFGEDNTIKDVDYLINVIQKSINELKI